MRRVLSVYLPGWAAQRAQRRWRCAHGSPPEALLMIEPVNGQERVVHGCAAARRAGVRAGMTLAHARALLSPCAPATVAHEPARDSAALVRLGAWCERWSPIVQPDPPDGLLLDISGCEHLFGGEERLARALGRGLRAIGFSARLGLASTVGAAWAAARFAPRGSGRLCIVPVGGERDALRDMPIRALRVDRETVDGLREVGVERIGQLLNLSRDSLPSRFGEELTRHIDQALGLAAEQVCRRRAHDPLSVSMELPGGTTVLESVEGATRRLLRLLCARLARREAGARTLAVMFERLGGTCESMTLELSRAARDAHHLFALLRPRLERLDMGFGIERIAIHARRVARIAHAQAQLDGTPERGERGTRDDEASAALLDTLAARFGHARVVRTVPMGSHIPERAQRTIEARESEVAAHRAGACERLRPSVLLQPPEPARVMALTPDGPIARFAWRGRAHGVTVCEGPERIAPEWWRAPDGDSARDYYRVQDEHGAWLWLFREARASRWFVHGVWA